MGVSYHRGMTRLRFLFLVVLGLFLVLAPSAKADAMIYTGSAVRVKTYGFVDIKLYKIDHFMASKPSEKSRKAVIEADVSKQFTWTMKHDLPAEKVKTALQNAFASNGYTDGGKIAQFLGVITAELKEDTKLTILYDANTKNTTITVPGGAKATVGGVEFMKGVWSIWFGVIDQPGIGDQLIAAL